MFLIRFSTVRLKWETGFKAQGREMKLLVSKAKATVRNKEIGTTRFGDR
jgi:hypothetical protein